MKKQREIEKLLYENYISKVKSFTTKYDIIELSILGAQEEFDDGLTPKKGSRLELVTKRIKDDFLQDRDIIITKIIRGGRGLPYQYHILFKFNENDEIQYSISIPSKKNLNKENFEWANYGKFSFNITEDSKIKELFASYSITEVANFIDEYFKEKK